ncbi:signal peptidase I [bacterium]|nr:signal peptidase I [bacterium]
MKQVLYFFWEMIKIFLIALLIVIPIREFVFQPFFVKGQSMEPNFHDYDYLIVDEISYRFHNPERGDVVVLKNPNNHTQKFIKRIIGLPGETVVIEDGKVIIEKDNKSFILDESTYLGKNNFTPGNLRVTLGSDEYFVMGDNRAHSYDSRYFGPIKRKDIIGRFALRVWPIPVFAHNLSY